MPQIGNVNLATTMSGLVSVETQPQGAIPGKDAHWSTVSYPELGRVRLEYSYRKADPSTGLVRHSFKVTIPTLKSVVTDPSGPYQPPPSVDYVTVSEMHFYVHARSTQAERDAGVATILRSILIDSTLIDVVKSVVAGQSVY